MDHLRAWITLAEQTCEAEFSEFELVQIFAVFNVMAEICHGVEDQLFQRARAKHFERLAKFIGVDLKALRAQYDDHLAGQERVCCSEVL